MTVESGDVLAVTVIHDNDTSGEAVNRFNFKLVSGEPIDDADVLDDMLEIVELLYGIIKSIISVRSVLRELNVYNITQLSILGSRDGVVYTGGVGADPAAPQGVAFLAYFKTIYSRVILSKYVVTPAAGALGVSGLVSAAAFTIMGSFAANMLLPFIMTNGTYDYGHWDKVKVRWVVPVLGVASVTPAYQRRRKPGRGA